MTVRRLKGIPGFSIDRVAAAAGDDPEVLRLENLDTDIPPPEDAIQATRDAVGRDDDNSYLPFTGTQAMREAVGEHIQKLSGHSYDPSSQIVISCGGTGGIFNALLAITDPDDEVVVTDPTYAGITYRVMLAGAEPVHVPFERVDNEWRLNLKALRSSITLHTKALLIMSPSMPSGAVLNSSEWGEIAKICIERKIWLIYDAAMERILYDGLALIHPLTIDGLAERTIVVGSVSKEYRMIGWRVGWIAGPREIMNDVAIVSIYNVVTPPGISQAGATSALRSANDGVLESVSEWERRRNVVCEQLRDYGVIKPNGCWSLLVDVGELGLNSFEASERLLSLGKVAATPMRDWGKLNSDQYVRLVFSNEPVERLNTLKERFDRSFG